jgi:hypothetical protein
VLEVSFKTNVDLGVQWHKLRPGLTQDPARSEIELVMSLFSFSVGVSWVSYVRNHYYTLRDPSQYTILASKSDLSRACFHSSVTLRSYRLRWIGRVASSIWFVVVHAWDKLLFSFLKGVGRCTIEVRDG